MFNFMVVSVTLVDIIGVLSYKLDLLLAVHCHHQALICQPDRSSLYNYTVHSAKSMYGIIVNSRERGSKAYTSESLHPGESKSLHVFVAQRAEDEISSVVK